MDAKEWFYTGCECTEGHPCICSIIHEQVYWIMSDGKTTQIVALCRIFVRSDLGWYFKWRSSSFIIYTRIKNIITNPYICQDMKSNVCNVYICNFIGVWHRTRDGRQNGSGCDSCGGRGIFMRRPTQSFSASIFAVLWAYYYNFFHYPPIIGLVQYSRYYSTMLGM